MIKMFFQNGAKQLVEVSLCHEFIAGFSAGKGIGKIVHNGQNGSAVPGKQRIYDDFMIHDIVYGFRTNMIIFYKNLKVENNTFINTGIVFRDSAVKHSVCDKEHISAVITSGVAVECEMKRAGQDAENFIVMMPVISHMISGTMKVLMIKCNGEIEGSLLSVFFVIEIFHETGSIP